VKPGVHLAVVTLLAACSRGPTPGPPSVAPAVPLASGAVAQVGATAIPPPLVADVALRRGESTEIATQQLVEDALMAEGAVVRGMDRAPGTGWTLTAARASFLVDAVRLAAATPDPTNDELRERAAAHWREVDLPEQFRVVHAVVLRPARSSPEVDARGRAIAGSIAAAVASASSAEDFEAKASNVAHPGFEVRVEKLPAFVADGRTSEGPDSKFDPAFAAAAAALKTSGATSDVVESSFGWHVIRLIEKLPPHRLSPDELRARLADEVRARRARKRLDELLAARRAATQVVTVEDADALLGGVRAGVP
jgi:PPIC-type PPIASE domain